jgi:hypothetical protein
MSKRIATVADGYVVVGRDDMWTFLLCTIRYAMGRRSYITGLVSDMYRTYREILTPDQRRQIAREVRRETEMQEQVGRTLGDKCDHAGWVALVAEIEAKEGVGQ